MDADLLNRWLTLLQRGKAYFTLALRNLANAIEADPADAWVNMPDVQTALLHVWLADWRARLTSEAATLLSALPRCAASGWAGAGSRLFGL